MTGHVRSDRRKADAAANHVHHDPAVRSLVAEREAAAEARGRAAGRAEVVAAVEATYPPYGYGMHPDGTKDATAAAYVEGFCEVDNALQPFRPFVGGAE